VGDDLSTGWMIRGLDAYYPGRQGSVILVWRLPTAFRMDLLLVSLDDGGRAHLGLIRILAELAPRVSLPEQIPTLIKFDLDGFQPYLIVIGECVLPVEMLLLVNETFDLLQDGVIGRRFSHINHLADSPLIFRS
jgi:hypothetical protein